IARPLPRAAGAGSCSAEGSEPVRRSTRWTEDAFVERGWPLGRPAATVVPERPPASLVELGPLVIAHAPSPTADTARTSPTSTRPRLPLRRRTVNELRPRGPNAASHRDATRHTPRRALARLSPDRRRARCRAVRGQTDRHGEPRSPPA